MGSIGNSNIIAETNPSLPSKATVLQKAKELSGSSLKEAIITLESSGDFYREDKRVKKDFVLEVIENVYKSNPVDSYELESNMDILEAVYGISKYLEDFYEKISKVNQSRR